MTPKAAVTEFFYYAKCLVRQFARTYVTRPDKVTIGGVTLKTDGTVLSPAMVRALYRGHYERAEQELLDATLTPHDRVLELGAGVGFISTFAAQRVKAKNVTVVEANPELIPLIEANHELNGFDIEIHNCVLGHEMGETTFYVAENFWASSLEDAPGRKPVSVPVRPLDAMLRDHSITYLVCDIEGGEASLFNADLLRRVPELTKACIELHPGAIGDDGVSAVLRAFLDAGFDLRLSKMREISVAYFSRLPDMSADPAR